jgi:hypothetical protein
MNLCGDILNELRQGKSIKEIISVFQSKGYSLSKINAAIINSAELQYAQEMTELEELKAAVKIK